MRRKKLDKAIIGLDIGSDSIKLFKGMKKDGKICVLDFTHRMYPTGQVTPDLVSRQIQELLRSVADVKKTRIHSTISGRKLCVRTVTLPVIPEAELYQALRSKIRKYVSPDIDQIVFSYSVLGETQEKGLKKLEVVFATIQKTFFDEYLQFFKLAAVRPAVITSACFSGWNLIRELNLDKGVDSLMFLNIDSQETDLTVYRENRFVFTRNISIGARDFTDKLQEEADILGKEIELTANHYYQIMHGRRIDKCIILGEGSQIAGLVDFLKKKLEIPIEGLHIPDAKLELPVDKKEEFKRDLPLHTQALGAILVGPDDINLAAKVSPGAKKGVSLIKFFAHPKMTTAATIAFVVLGLVIFAFLKGFNVYYQRQIESYKIIRDKFQDRTLQLMQIKRKVDILDFEKRLHLRLLKEHPAYPVIIAEICKAIPSESIVLDELRFSSERRSTPAAEAPPLIKFIIEGRTVGKDATSAETTRFALSLERSGYFENVSVTIRERTPSPDAGWPAEEKLPVKRVGELGFAIDGIIRLKD